MEEEGRAGQMNISTIQLYVIKMPLKIPFSNPFRNSYRARGHYYQGNRLDGVSGYGEGVAFSTPWYTEETVKTSLHMLTDILIPITAKKCIYLILKKLANLFKSVKRNHMAKAGLEMALWDLYSKKQASHLLQ